MPNQENRSFRPLVGLVLALLSTAGCYSFRPVTTPQTGVDVRATLNVEAAIRRSEGLDEPIRFVDGRIVEYAADTLSLDVLVARSASMFQDVEIRDTVRLMTSEIASIEERRLSLAKTALFGAAAVGGAIVLVSGISSVVGGNEEDPPDGNEAILVPIFSVGRLGSIRVLGITLLR
jgi:hypothetical protein